MGWPSAESATSTYTYRSYRPEKAHPLDNAVLRNNTIHDVFVGYRSAAMTNEYVEELRILIDERTAALADVERSMRLPDAHPGRWDL
jgi:hypothetical protein